MNLMIRDKEILKMLTWICFQETFAEVALLNWVCPPTISAGQREILPPVLNAEKNKLHFQSCGNNYIFKVTINHHKLSTSPLGEEKFKTLMYYFCQFEKKLFQLTWSVMKQSTWERVTGLYWVSTLVFVLVNNSNHENDSNIYNYYICCTPLYVKYFRFKVL